MEQRNGESRGERRAMMLGKMEKLLYHLEAMRIGEYVELLEQPKRLIFTNFVAGIARGLGMAVGASLVFALLLSVLQKIIILNIPIIGNIVADIVKIVAEQTRGAK
ncbi:MAG: DUF5665 domain-containing protein [Negativicutes bacterium]|nr:DUF5665 domain-containing protein [Negativicutes bacterium]